MKLYDRLIELENLKTEKYSGVARQRGFDFERLVRDIFLKQNLLSVIKQTGIRTSDNGSEQIDGVINLDGRIFLLEAKWDEKLAASSLYEFIGKIENKFYGTLGIFISYHPLSDNFVNALRKGRKQNVIIIHGEDVKLLFKNEIDLRQFLKYAIERLSYDNLSHISVKEFLNFTKNKTKQKVTIQIDDSKIKKFITSYITSKKNIDSLELEIEIDKLTPEEKAKTYLILFKHSEKLFNISFPIPASYNNVHLFFSIYKPDFKISLLENLPDEYFSNYIFKAPKTYLLKFINVFIDEFPNISKDKKDIFEKRIIDLYKTADWEIENALTYILEKFENLYSKHTLNEIHKFYINYYYSSVRENRFPQKTYAIHLIKDRKIKKETVIKWVQEKLIYDLELYENCKEFNITYFAKTYLDLGTAIGLDKIKWFELLKKIYTQQCV